MTWKTIESAPKDGSILWLATKRWVRAGFWTDDEDHPWKADEAPTHWQPYFDIPLVSPPAPPESA